MKKRTAVVMNCHYNGLSIIRELGKHGVPVIAMDWIRSIGTFSRYAKYRKSPNPAEQENAFIEYLYNTAAGLEDKPVLMPTNDVWAMAIARHKQKLLDVALPCVADLSVIDILINKVRFNQWCTENNYPIPMIWDILDYKSIPANSFPVILKPISRRKSSNDEDNVSLQKFLDKNRIIVLNNKTDLEAEIVQLGELASYFFIQEYVPGLSDCMYTIGIYANQEHEVKGVFTGKKLRGYPADIGDCRLGQSHVLPQHLIDMVADFCKKIGYFGIAEFEFKQDDQSGIYKLIEVNPRSWSWVGITPYCGVNLPWMAYADIAGLEKTRYAVSNLKTGEVKYVRLFDDFVNCLFRYKRDGYPQWSYTMREWAATLRSEKLVMAEFDKTDFFAVFIFHANNLLKVITDCWKHLMKTN